LAEHYGLKRRFPIRWIPSGRPFRRYDFSLVAVASAWRWRADLYYVWPLQAAALASSLGLPTALEVHDRPQGRLGPTLFRIFLKGKGARRTLPITEALRSWLASTYQAALEAPFARVAPMGVDLERYRDLPAPSAARRELDLPEAFTASYTGHLYPGRGVGLLMELARRNRGLVFVWAGGEPEAVDSWRRKLAAAGVDNVRMLGFVPNDRLPLVHAASDVLLMPYERHIAGSSGGDTAGFASPMKVFEYLAAGRAILSSDLPVLREVLNESNAVLLPPGDLDAWTSALRDLAADPRRRRSLARQARRDAARYSWDERAGMILEGLETKHAA
jgi:glycosyltransferase involved in cell wall biosynthesis